jgi:SAM-dependent methyltransferase
MKAIKLRSAIGGLLLPASLPLRLRTTEESLAEQQIKQQILRREIESLADEQQILRREIEDLHGKISELRLGLLDHRSHAALVTRKLVAEANRRSRHAAQPYDIEEQRSKLSAMFPHVYPAWAKLFENARVEYESRPVTSLSVQGNPGSSAFAKFALLYAHGSVLDVGCGPQGLPVYLAGLRVDRIVGVDPLPGSDARDFEFFQSYGEFLPWPDGEFDVVISATSLDHAISLDMTLREIKRVLRPGGYFLTWVGFVPGASPYDPNDPETKPIDEYHLFHFDRSWFLDLLLKFFHLEEEFRLDNHSHFFAFST